MNETRKITELSDHPINSKIYTSARPAEDAELVRSIKANGVMLPLDINSKNVILGGHRRKKAALEAGLVEVPVRVIETDDEEFTIIQLNMYRRKTLTEIMAEAERLYVIEAKRGKDAMTMQGTANVGPTRERVAATLGIGSGVQLDKLRKVFDMAKTNATAAEKVRQIDAGEISVHGAFKSLFHKEPEDFGFDMQVYSLWYFGFCEPSLGIPHPGRIAGQIVQNVLWYYTQPGDLVIDPFAGGGVTIDACKGMDRRCIALDINPVREDIHKHDITLGYPVMNVDEAPQLVFADPPYGNMLETEYDALGPSASVSELSIADFTEMLYKFCADSFKVLRSGGFLAVITMPQAYKLPDGVPYLDWPFEVRLAMDEAGFVPYRRITNRWPTSIWNAHQVNQGKDSKHLLQVTGDIVVGKKP